MAKESTAASHGFDEPRVPRTAREHAANDLVDVAKFAPQQEIHQWDVTRAQLLEVDTRAEHPAPPIPGMRHLSAPDHPDSDGRVEQRQVDRGLHVVDLLNVLGVQAVVPAQGQVRDAVTALQPDRLHFHDAGLGELSKQPQSLGAGPKHGVEQVRTGLRCAQDPAQEYALVDLAPFFFRLWPRTLGCHLLVRGHQAGISRGGGPDEFVDAQVLSPARGEFVVDVLGMRLDVVRAHRPDLVQRRGRGVTLCRGPGRRQRQLIEQVIDSLSRHRQGSAVEPWRQSHGIRCHDAASRRKARSAAAK